MLSIKVHRNPSTTMVAVADMELVGKRFKEGKKILDISVSFYGGDEVPEDNLGSFLETAEMGLLAGERSVGLGIELGYLDREATLTIDGIPYGQFFFCP